MGLNRIRKKKTASLHHPYHTSLADKFASFFTDKISNLQLSLSALPTTSSPHFPPPPATSPYFSTFRPATESKISEILSNRPNKQSNSDPIPTWLLKECSSVLIPQSRISSTYPFLKQSTISPFSRYPPWTKTSYPVTARSSTFLLYPKSLNISSNPD